ncbi:hypothetical protein FXO37_01911 [Capsicum annuum]|nr:hypothetical protein FXO37_01911 [Capsicum annuum]
MTNLPSSLSLGIGGGGIGGVGNGGGGILGCGGGIGGDVGGGGGGLSSSSGEEGTFPGFGPLVVELIWYYRCTPTGDSFYLPCFVPPNLTPAQSNRVCNALALLQVDDTEVISFLLTTEIIPLCLRTMEMGSELSKTVATFIVQKIILDDVGLDYICTTAERACDVLRTCLPDMLRDTTFSSYLREDTTTRRWLQQLLHNVSGNRVALQAGGFDHLLVKLIHTNST